MPKHRKVTIVRLADEHRAEWERLYADYAAFYKVAQTGEMRETVWNWINDPDHEVEALVAIDDAGKPVGLAHYRPFARPLSATTAGYLDDLFVERAWRGQAVADALIDSLADEGRARGWSIIRWTCLENNYRARGLYDRVADRTSWLTYEIKLTG